MNNHGHSVGVSSRWWEQECVKHVTSGKDYGTELLSSLAEEERIVRGGLWLWRRLARYGGRPEPNALNVIVESLK